MEDVGMRRTERNGGGWLEAWSVTAMGCYSFYQHMGPMDARYVYGVLFLIANFIAWALRENPTSLFQIQRLTGCQGNRDCFAAEAVLMLFFFVMFLSTVYTKNVHEVRNSWHSKWWVPKIFLLASCFLVSVFAPNYITKFYGKAAHFGAGIFIFIQLVSVVRYITRFNSRWCGQSNFDNHHRKVNTISILAYGCSMVGIIVMIFRYVGCYVNAALVLSTVALVYFMPIISLLSKEKGFYMEPMLMGVYIVFLCWAAIKSEPKTSCYKKENTGSGVNWITVISFIAELVSVTVATFSTGSNYKSLQFANVVESENDVPYGYGFFHFVFALGSMYFGMLFVSWDTHHASEKWSMDVGWTSTVVHLVNEGLAVIFYVVVVLARCYGIGWLQQLLGKMFGTGGQQLADDHRPPVHESAGATVEMTDNNRRPPQDEPLTTEEPPEDNNRQPRAQEEDQPNATAEPVVRTNERDNEQPSSSSSSTMKTGPLRTSEPQAPVLRRRHGEIEELW